MDILLAAWQILTESAIYILLGFLIAGLLEAGFSGRGLVRLLAGRKLSSVGWAAVLGVPLPLCSCSVLPTALALRKQGAGKGAVLSFLISTPETSVTSILLSYSLLGPLWAIFRPIAAAFTALSAGAIEILLDKQQKNDEDDTGHAESTIHDHEHHHHAHDGHDHSHSHFLHDEAEGSFVGRLRRSMHYAFVDLFDDIFAWILLGVIAAAVLQAFIPADSLQAILGGPLQSMLLMVLIGVPLYVCAEASTPIAAILLAQGVDPGAVLVFLLVGPGTNIGSLGALNEVLGRRTIAIYLLSIIGAAVLMGMALNAVIASNPIDVSTRVLDEPLLPLWLKTAGAIFFLLLGTNSVVRGRWFSRSAAIITKYTGIPVTPAITRVAFPLMLLLSYASQGVVVVQPGEAALKQRFGAVQGPVMKPGWYLCWPYPIERVTTVAVDRIQRTTVGWTDATAKELTRADESLAMASISSGSDQPSTTEPGDASDDTWSLLGDENIADVQIVAHWYVDADSLERYLFHTGKPAELMDAVVQGASRSVFATASITSALTSQRQALEAAIEDRARQTLAAYECGMILQNVHIVDAHAPLAVHGSFRDVAGALEDRAARINQARAERSRILPRARGNASQSLAEADGYAAGALYGAQGEVAGFSALLQERKQHPTITDRRLEFEMLERVLPKLKKYIKPSQRNDGEVEIWILDGASSLENAEAWP
ncbi:MAG: SO_0444 family Cu/Zn efflux transporter [Phycisphaerae bacterium]